MNFMAGHDNREPPDDVISGDDDWDSREIHAQPAMPFEWYASQNRTRLLRTAYMLVGDWHEAEDMVQEALLRAHPHWDRAATSPDGYVHRILVNLSRDRHRRLGRRAQETLWTTDDLGHHDPTAELATVLTLRRLLPTLPYMQRAVVVLRYFNDLPVREVAQIMGIREGTVKSHSDRALKALRAGFGRGDEPTAGDGS